MKFITGSLLSLFIIFSCTSNTSNQGKKAVFGHHEISRPLPGESWERVDSPLPIMIRTEIWILP
ncbi:MAG: hypothetical protein KGY69_17245 [Bacteroidales bacterium]|nr:hypothetical protein [Bacteroidales bacterium]